MINLKQCIKGKLRGLISLIGFKEEPEHIGLQEGWHFTSADEIERCPMKATEDIFWTSVDFCLRKNMHSDCWGRHNTAKQIVLISRKELTIMKARKTYKHILIQICKCCNKHMSKVPWKQRKGGSYSVWGVLEDVK